MSSSRETTPLVSVVIPTYHWSAALRLAIRSVQLQTVQDFEILVVGDGCTDETEQVVASFNDPRIRWFNLDRNHGSQWAANNLANENARAEWIAYLGHDDIWYPTHLEAILRAARADDADVVASVLAMYAPAESGMRGIAGLFASGTYSANDFVPPSAFAHARNLYGGLIKWQDPDKLALPMDAQYLNDVVEAGQKFSSTRELTVFKFNAAFKRDSYKVKSVEQQQDMLARIESGIDFRQQELIGILECAVSGKFISCQLPSILGVEPGSVVRLNRKRKGIDRRFEPSELSVPANRMRFDLSRPPMTFEWHELQPHPLHQSFRWSGPSPTATIDLPVVFDRDLSIRMTVVHSLVPYDQISVLLHGQRLDSRWRLEPDGSVLIEAEALVSRHARPDRDFGVTVAVEKTLRPCDLGDSTDSRFLGVAVSSVEIEPLQQPGETSVNTGS